MSPSAQRIAIAEACGWKLRTWSDRRGRPCSGWTTPQGEQCGGIPPDCLNDLNAMHEAEKVLSDDQIKDYGFFLENVVCPQDFSNPADYDMIVAIARAKAAQRSEAFLKTLELWVEEESK